MAEAATQYLELPIPLGVDTATQPEIVQPGRALGVRNCEVGNGALIERRPFTRIARTAFHDAEAPAAFRHGEVRALLPLGGALLIATEEARLYAKVDLSDAPWTEVERNDSPVSFKRALHCGALHPGDEAPYRYRNPNIAISGDYACITWYRYSIAADEEDGEGHGWAMVYDLAKQVIVRIDEVVTGTIGIGTPGADGSNPSLIPVAISGTFFVLWIDTGSNQIKYRSLTVAGLRLYQWSAPDTLVNTSAAGVNGTFDVTVFNNVLYGAYNGGTINAFRATASGSVLTVTSSIAHGSVSNASAFAIAVNTSRCFIAFASSSGTIFGWALNPATMTGATDGAVTQISTTGTTSFKQLACCIYTVTDYAGASEIRATVTWADYDGLAELRHEFTSYVADVDVEHLTSHTADEHERLRAVNLCHRPFRLSGLGAGTANFAASYAGLRHNQTAEDTYYTYVVSRDSSAEHDIAAPRTSVVTPVARYSGLTAAYVRGTDDGEDVEEQGVCAVVEHGGRYHWVGVEQVPTYDGEVRDTLHIYSLDFSTARCWSSVTVNGVTLVAGSIPRMISPEVLWPTSDAAERRGMEGIVPLHSPPPLELLQTTGGALTLLGDYYYCATYEYTDVTGRVHRSLPSTAQRITLGGSNNRVAIGIVRWQSPMAGYRHHNLVFWRSAGNPADTNNITFYRLADVTVHSLEDLTISAYVDDASDASIANNEILYTVSGELPNYPPPPSLALCLWKNRIVALDSETGKIWPSKTILEREWPGFHEGLAIGTDVHTSLPIFISEDTDNLIVWWSDAIGVVYGEPGSDTGAPGSLTQPRLLGQRGVGLKYVKSLVRTEIGHMFMSNRGIYLLDPSMGLTYIGRDVEAYNSHVVVGAYVAQTPNGTQCVRFETQTADSYADGYTTLVYDLVKQSWHVHTRGRKPLAAATIGGNVYLATQAEGSDAAWDPIPADVSGVWVESTSTTIPEAQAQDPSGVYGTLLDTCWFAPAGMLGVMRTRRLWMLGDLDSSFRDVSTSVLYDYDNGTEEQGPVSTGITTPLGTLRRSEFDLARQECGAIRLRIRNFQRLLALRLEVEPQRGALRRNNQLAG